MIAYLSTQKHAFTLAGFSFIRWFYFCKSIGAFEGAMQQHGNFVLFTPLIAAMAGNVGVQSSAIIVQGLANNTLSGSLI
jgi:magnesium transporter